MAALVIMAQFEIESISNTSRNTSSLTDNFPIQNWLLACYLLVASVGFIGNSLVLCVVLSDERMRSSSFGTYLGSLAVADILVAITCLPVYMVTTSWFAGYPHGFGGDVLCKVLSGYNIPFFFATVSVYTLVAISYERYYAICNPLSSITLANPRRAKKIVAIIWIVSVILVLQGVYGYSRVYGSKATVGAHCKFSNAILDKAALKVIKVIAFIYQYALPVLCMIWCFLRIKFAMDRRMHEVKNKFAKLQHGEIVLAWQRKRTVITVIMFITAHAVLWTPMELLMISSDIKALHRPWNSNLIQSAMVLCFFSCCVNPVIYSFRSKQFRHGFAKFLCCKHFAVGLEKFSKMPKIRGDAVRRQNVPRER